MAIFFPPPPPIVAANAAQPYSPGKLPPSITAVPVNNPPFGSTEGLAVLVETVAAAQPPAWPYVYFGGAAPYAPLALEPGVPGQSVDNPPFVHRGRTVPTAIVIASAQPDPWTYNFAGGRQPYDFRKLAPGVPGQSVDNPPFTHPSRTVPAAVVAALAQPDPWTYNFAGGRQPFEPGKLSPGVPGQSVDRPPFSRREAALRAEAIALTQPDPWVYSFFGAQQPYAPLRTFTAAIGVPHDNPPFAMRKNIAQIALINQTWQPPDPQPWHRWPAYKVSFVVTFTQGFIIG